MKMNVKRLLAVVLALVLTMSLVLPAVAEDTDAVAKIGSTFYATLQEAFDAAQDGETIYVLKDITITAATAGYTDGTYTDGVRYTGDKSFTVDFGGFTVTDDGCVNDYLIYMNNKGEKENEITLINGTIVPANGCWATVCVNSDAATQESTVNLNSVNVTNKYIGDAGNEAVRARKGATVNIDGGAVITSDKSSAAVTASSATGVVNVNSGAKLVQKNSADHKNSNYVGAAVTGTGTVNIYDGAIIESDRFGAYTSTTQYPVVNVYGGSITAPTALMAATNGGSNQAATINVYGGTIDGALNEYTDAGNVWLYGGTFVDATMDTLSAYLPAGAAAVLDSNGTLVPSTDAVASLGSLGYTSLAAAITAANGKTVTLLKNVELTETITIAVGKSVTLELNGKILSGVSSEAASSAVIANNGTLVIQDSIGGGKVTSQALTPDTDWGGEGQPAFPTYANNTITNCGQLTLLSGTIECATSGGACYAVDNNSGNRPATLNVKGGSIIHTANNFAVRMFCNSTVNGNTVNVENGTLSGRRAIWIQLPGSKNQQKLATVTISGGTLTSTDTEYNQAIYSYSYGDSYETTTVTVSGGTFNGDLAFGGGSSYGGEGAETVNITGGTFNGARAVYHYNSQDKITVSGGSFAAAPADNNYAAYMAEGLSADVAVEDYYIVHAHDSNADIDPVESSCTETGLTAGKKCSVCGKTMVAPTETPVKEHNWSTDYQPGTDTHWHYCTSDGCTAKKDEAAHTFVEKIDNVYIVEGTANDCAIEYITSCSVCGKGNEEKTFWVVKDNPTHTYDEGIVTKEATCTEAGVKTYTCTNKGCGHTKTEPIAVKSHTEVDLAAKEATCTETGLTAGKKCSVCGTVTKAQETVAAKGHTEVDVPAKEATCTETGLTAGKKCSVCGTVTVAQTEVAAKGHKLTKVEASDATYFAAGNIEHYTCEGCDKLFADAEGKEELAATDVVIAQLVKIEDTTADVSTEVVDNVIKEAETAGTVDIVITVTKDEMAEEEEKEEGTAPDSGTTEPAPAPVVTKTQLPAAAVEKIAALDEKATLTVNMTNATVVMDKTTLDVVAEAAKTEKTDSIALEIEHIETKELTTTQQKAVEEKKVAAVISASILVNDKEVHDFEGGKVTVSIPFTPAEGTKGSDYVVLYVADDGTVEEIPTAYADGTLVMTLSHFSEYVVVDTSAKASTPATGDSFSPMVVFALLAVSAAAIVVLTAKKRRSN